MRPTYHGKFGLKKNIPTYLKDHDFSSNYKFETQLQVFVNYREESLIKDPESVENFSTMHVFT